MTPKDVLIKYLAPVSAGLTLAGLVGAPEPLAKASLVAAGLAVLGLALSILD